MINRALLAYIKAASRFLLAFELGTYYGSVENYGFRDYPRNSFMLRSDSPIPFFLDANGFTWKLRGVITLVLVDGKDFTKVVNMSV